MDDVLFATECNTDRLMQNLIYSGYVFDTTIKNIFAHGPDGVLFLGTEVSNCKILALS